MHTNGLGLIHTVRFFSNCDCDLSYYNKWVVQDSKEVFTLCDCDNLTISYSDPNDGDTFLDLLLEMCEYSVSKIEYFQYFFPTWSNLKLEKALCRSDLPIDIEN